MTTESYSPHTRPFWSDTISIHKQPHQTSQVSVDVCVIGAGITGLTAADLLKRAGKTVAVIDLGRIGFGETSHTTAHLTEVFDIDYRDLISTFGLEGATLAAQSVRRAIERIEENVARYGIECDFKRVSGYRYTEGPRKIQQIEAESEAALRAGVPNELIFDAPLPFHTERAMQVDHQAQFNPLAYLDGLAQRIAGGGSYIFEETRMLDVEEGEPCRVETDRGTIIAEDVFVASNVPSLNRFILHTKIAAYRTYAIAARAKREIIRSLYWDVDDPYHYIRTFDYRGAQYLVIGGEDHKTGQESHTNAHFERLEEFARKRFEIEAVTHHWSGQIIEPVDGLPYIGRNPMSDHVFVATGYSGTGLTFGTVAGMLVSDLIIGHQNPWADLYDAGRVKPMASIRNYLKENFDFPSHLIGDRFTPAQAAGTDRLREDEGAIVRVGGKKIAAYRDPQGELHLLSPVCPHLGCYVQWNEAEKSWDCPCHGSRFNAVGQLMNGPAVSDLASERADEDAPMIPERYDQPATPEPLGPPLFSMFVCPLKTRTQH